MLSLQTPRARRFVTRFNARVLAWRSSPRWGRPVRRYLTIVSYTGRRSGRRFSIPVGYRRSGDVVVIPVGLSDAKSWWRNFLGDGGPATVELDGAVRPGHAVARRDDRGRVTVTLQLTAEGGRDAEHGAEVPATAAE
ncbi:hypothetical protein GCM10009809_34970 [Isoptericola hypogeus]|uniref:Deazaflavin-dependent oxidoreductase (Nitroreductase family) n=1 Tax=Isoptericola hypogeus TaxID=300179 RepID=A0ABN2JRS1_9MICO